MKIEDYEFEKLKNFMLSTYGMDLSKKRVLVESRLKQPASANGFANLRDYIAAAMQQPEMKQELVTRLTTNFTFFLREDIHYEYMVKNALPALMGAVKSSTYSPRLWSAGCSSGDEAYTAAIYLKEMQRSSTKLNNFSITATDISDTALKQAREGIYTKESLKNLPDGLRDKYFIKTDDDRYRVSADLSTKVKISRFNLMDPIPKQFTNFDVIFCRNVMIYFTPEIRKQIAKKLFLALKPGGYLFTGLSESLPAAEIGLKTVRPSVFVREQ